ncbi:hypothetical protein IAD21_00897 [Abditibacteriota bacterium]|nr:hypothetical protein IAD21_00897 [Abditibacteriota bacterium]
MELQWTTDEPQQEGWYWTRKCEGKEMIVPLARFPLVGDLRPLIAGVLTPLEHLTGYEWAGPIPLPISK